MMSNYSIWMLEYAHCPVQPVGAILAGQFNAGTRLLTYSYLVIQGKGHTAMVDVGHNYADYGRDLSLKYDVVNWQSPEKVLAKVGIKREDIDTIILTHAHYDHMGNVNAYPNAHFYLQKREINEWLWALSLPSRFQFLTQAVDPQDILNAVTLSAKGRLTLLDGNYDNVLEDIHVRPIFNSHTFGSQLVVIENGDKTWVVSGDNAFSYENLEGLNGDGNYIPIGFGVGNQLDMMLALDEMMKIADHDTNRIIIGHEPQTWSRFPSCQTEDGLYFAELALADGEFSRIR
jgi:N-acyl homoserine lactone hydrolase